MGNETTETATLVWILLSEINKALPISSLIPNY